MSGVDTDDVAPNVTYLPTSHFYTAFFKHDQEKLVENIQLPTSRLDVTFSAPMWIISRIVH
jgi:hypothetical protein